MLAREMELRLDADAWFVTFLKNLEGKARGFTEAGMRQKAEDDEARF